MRDELLKSLDLIQTGCSYLSEDLVKRREDLRQELETCKNEARLLVKLRVISKAIRYYSDVARFENINKVRMLAFCELDKQRRLGRNITDDSTVDTVRPFKALP